MNTIAQECLNSIENYLSKERMAFYGLFMGVCPGAYCHIMTDERSYFIHYLIDEQLMRVFVDVYPQCICERPYRNMMHTYINRKTSTLKSGRVDIGIDGEIKIRLETSITDHPISGKDINDMENLAIQISNSIEKKIDRIAHGCYFEEDDFDIVSNIKKAIKKTNGTDDSDGIYSIDDIYDAEDDEYDEAFREFMEMYEKFEAENGENDKTENDPQDDNGEEPDSKSYDDQTDDPQCSAEKSFEDLFSDDGEEDD